MLALLDAVRDGRLDAEIVGVGSDRDDAPGLEAAAVRGVRTRTLPRGPGTSRAEHEASVDAWLSEGHADLVALAGYMRVLSPAFVGAWAGRLVNIHPSLLPRHPGLDTHARALAAGDDEHGCTVHFVTADVDAGPVVARAALDVRPDDTAETLAARVLALEHRLYPAALADVLSGRTAFAPAA